MYKLPNCVNELPFEQADIFHSMLNPDPAGFSLRLCNPFDEFRSKAKCILDNE